MLLRVQILRVIALGFRARAALEAARIAPEPRLLRMAERDVRRMLRTGTPYATAAGTLLEAGLHELRGRRDEALAALVRAEEGLSSCQLGLAAAIARRQRGILLGDAELVAEGDAFIREQGLPSPARAARLFIGGFAWA
jgi:hypothetical protein